MRRYIAGMVTCLLFSPYVHSAVILDSYNVQYGNGIEVNLTFDGITSYEDGRRTLRMGAQDAAISSVDVTGPDAPYYVRVLDFTFILSGGNIMDKWMIAYGTEGNSDETEYKATEVDYISQTGMSVRVDDDEFITRMAD
jgi:hypothetical protein